MAKSVILMKAELLPHKNGQNHNKWPQIPGDALAHRAGWAFPFQDTVAFVLMCPDKKGCLITYWLLLLLLQKTRKNGLRRKRHKEAKVTSDDEIIS